MKSLTQHFVRYQYQIWLLKFMLVFFFMTHLSSYNSHCHHEIINTKSYNVSGKFITKTSRISTVKCYSIASIDLLLFITVFTISVAQNKQSLNLKLLGWFSGQLFKLETMQAVTNLVAYFYFSTNEGVPLNCIPILDTKYFLWGQKAPWRER